MSCKSIKLELSNSPGNTGGCPPSISMKLNRSSLLLTAANLAQIHANSVEKETTCKTKEENLRYYLEQTGQSNPLFSLSSENIKKPDPDTVSVASSMHFTVVNVDTRPPVKPRSFCRKHQLTVLVVTMSALFTIGILAAIVLLESK